MDCPAKKMARCREVAVVNRWPLEELGVLSDKILKIRLTGSVKSSNAPLIHSISSR